MIGGKASVENFDKIWTDLPAQVSERLFWAEARSHLADSRICAKLEQNSERVALWLDSSAVPLRNPNPRATCVE